MKSRSPALIFLLMLFVTLQAHAVDTIDQQNPAANVTITATSNNPTLGQSFTPTQPSINLASFTLATNEAGKTFRVDLHQGSGYGGAVLASSAEQPIPVGLNSPAPVNFIFATPATLIPGNVFTLRLVMTSPAGAGFSLLALASLDNYAGGNAFAFSALAAFDLAFSEGNRRPDTPAENLACARDGIRALPANQVAGPAQRNMMLGLIDLTERYLASPYESLSANALQAVIARTNGCALRGSPDTITRGATEVDFVTGCAAQGPIYACLKAAQTQMQPPP